MDYYKVDLGGRAYTYAWDGEPLEPGEFVVLPANDLHPKPFEGRVIRELRKPDYDGEIKQIISRA